MRSKEKREKVAVTLKALNKIMSRGFTLKISNDITYFYLNIGTSLNEL